MTNRYSLIKLFIYPKYNNKSNNQFLRIMVLTLYDICACCVLMANAVIIGVVRETKVAHSDFTSKVQWF